MIGYNVDDVEIFNPLYPNPNFEFVVPQPFQLRTYQQRQPVRLQPLAPPFQLRPQQSVSQFRYGRALRQSRIPALPIATFVPAPGDWVKVFSPARGVWHHGIVTVWNAIETQIAHNMKDTGTTVTNWDGFSGGMPVFLHQHAFSDQHVWEMVERINANLNKPYYLFSQNCEHFASFVFTGNAESPTVKNVGFLALTGVALVALFG